MIYDSVIGAIVSSSSFSWPSLL